MATIIARILRRFLLNFPRNWQTQLENFSHFQVLQLCVCVYGSREYTYTR